MGDTAEGSTSDDSDGDGSPSTQRVAGPTRDQVTCGSRTPRADASCDRQTDASSEPRTGPDVGSAVRWLVLTLVLVGAVGALVAAGAGGAGAQASGDATPDYTTDAEFSVGSPHLGLLPWGTDDPRVEAGGSFAIGATVTNTGSEAGTRYVVFVPPVSCENFENGRLPVVRRAVTLEPGEQRDVAFRCDVPADADPTTTQPAVGVMNVQDQVQARRPAETYDWGSSTGFRIVEPVSAPQMELRSVTVRGSPQVGSPVTVGAAVNNTGGPGNASLTLSVDGTQVATATGEVNRDQRDIVPLTYVPEPGSWGEQRLTVTTGDDSSTGSITVAPQPFDLQPQQIPTSVSAGERVSVAVGVTNAGNASDVQPLGLVLGSERVDEASVSLDPGAASTVTLSGTVPADATGSVNVSVVGPTDVVSGPVPVSGQADGLEVSFESVRDPLMPGAETVEVRANVTNPGTAARTGTVGFDVGSQTVDSAEVTVDGGSSTAVTLSGPVGPTAGGSVDLAVSTGGDEAARTVSVAQPLEVTIADSYQPAPNGEDGLYRDVTGDGSVTQGDVVILFRNMLSQGVRTNDAYFDFNGNGVFGHGDIAALFEYVATRSLELS